MSSDIYLKIVRDPRFPGYVLLTEADWEKILIWVARSSNISFLSDKEVAPNEIKEAVAQPPTSDKCNT